MGASVMDVVDADAFEREVVRASRDQPVVVDFWAPWCQPCRVIAPILEGFAEQDRGRWRLVRVDVQDHPELAEPYEVTGIPAVLAFRDGRVIEQFVGALPPAQVRAWLDRLSPPPADIAVLAGEAATNPAERAEHFRRALALRPDHPRALLGLAEIDLDEARVAALPASLPPELATRRARLVAKLESQGADAAALERAVEANPADLDARWKLAHARAAEGELDAACGHLIEIVRRDRTYRDDGARKAMLSIFDIAGPDSPVIQVWRRKLSSELFS